MKTNPFEASSLFYRPDTKNSAVFLMSKFRIISFINTQNHETLTSLQYS